MNSREELLIEAMTEIRRIANDSGNHRFMIAKIYDIATQAVRLEPDGVAQQPLEPFGYVALYCGAELFMRHKGAADFYADLCEVIPLYTASTVTSTVRHDVEKTEDGASSYCKFCDLEHQLHEDTQGFHHVINGERVPCCSVTSTDRSGAK